MPSVALTAHSITVHHSGPGTKSLGPPLPVGDFDGAGTGIIPYIKNRLERLEPNPNPKKKRASTLEVSSIYAELIRFEEAEAHTVRGVVDYGGYGMGGRIVDKDSGAVRLKKKRGDAELLPYYFRVYASPSNEKALLITQKIGQRSLLKLFSDYIGKGFSGAYPGYKMSVNWVVPTAVLRRYLMDGDVKQVEVGFDEVPPDVADEYYGGGAKPERKRAKLRQILKPVDRKSKLWEPEWVRAIQDGAPFPSHLEMFGMPVDEAAVQVSYGGKQRRIVVSDFEQFKGSIDITDSVQTDDDNVPTFLSVDAEAKAVLDIIKYDLSL